MKPVLLLAPPRAGLSRERRRVDLCRTDVTDAAEGTDYSSVIVLNDGSVETIRRLRRALALRDQQRNLRVGLLTYLDERQQADSAALIDTAGPLSVLGAVGPELRVELRDEVLSLEYQAD